MSGGTPPKFPPEMFDAIIDEVCALNMIRMDLEKILGVFSLVSKSWFPRSRHHLFQTVTMKRGQRGEAKPFMDLFDNPLCTFKPYVQILELDDGLYDEPRWLGDALPRLSTLPVVRDLTIFDGTFTSPNSAKVLSKFHNLQLLELDYCRFTSPTQLLETLSICTSLKGIGLYNVTMSHSNSPSAVNRDSSPPSSLRFIQIFNDSNKDMMEWLVSGEQIPSIDTLGLSVRNDETQAFAQCLRRLGPSLKNLEVRFITGRFGIEFQNAFWGDVDLRYNTNLNSICFKCRPVPSLLARVTSKVHQVVVENSRFEVESLEEVDWDTMARILDQPNFSELESLIMRFEMVYDAEEAREWMMQRLPPGRARDKLLCRNRKYVLDSGYVAIVDSSIRVAKSLW